MFFFKRNIADKAVIKNKGRDDIKLIIIGDGVANTELIERVRITKTNVNFFDHQTIATVKDAIIKADIGLVTLRPNIFKYAYPGKVMSYLEQGKPIVTTAEIGSELTKTMIKEGYGFNVSIFDINGIAKLFINLADDTSWKTKMGQAALKSYDKHFSREKILKKWISVLDNIKEE